jgi:hypothetical protein
MASDKFSDWKPEHFKFVAAPTEKKTPEAAPTKKTPELTAVEARRLQLLAMLESQLAATEAGDPAAARNEVDAIARMTPPCGRNSASMSWRRSASQAAC